MLAFFLIVAAIAAILLIAFGPAIAGAVRRAAPPWRAVTGIVAALTMAEILVGWPAAAFAQDASTVPGDGSVAAWLATAFAGLATVAIVEGIRRFTGVTLAQKWQDDIHRAAETGAKVAIARMGVGLGTPIDEAVKPVVAYVNRSVPDAVKKLAPSPDVLRDIAIAKLGDAIGRIGAKPIV